MLPTLDSGLLVAPGLCCLRVPVLAGFGSLTGASLRVRGGPAPRLRPSAARPVPVSRSGAASFLPWNIYTLPPRPNSFAGALSLHLVVRPTLPALPPALGPFAPAVFSGLGSGLLQGHAPPPPLLHPSPVPPWVRPGVSVVASPAAYPLASPPSGSPHAFTVLVSPPRLYALVYAAGFSCRLLPTTASDASPSSPADA
nr:actin cytoskeleton-regulatory complex protein PAN1-like [Penaeus vannamei]